MNKEALIVKLSHLHLCKGTDLNYFPRFYKIDLKQFKLTFAYLWIEDILISETSVTSGLKRIIKTSIKVREANINGVIKAVFMAAILHL